MKPVADIVRDTLERTRTAWKQSPHKELLLADILEAIDAQIEKAVAGTKL